MTENDPATEKPSSPLLSDRMYNILKAMVTIVFPALGALYFALAQIWGLPEPEKVLGTIAAVSTFLGVLIGISTKSYNNSDAKYDGALNVQDNGGGTKLFSLEVNGDPRDLVNKEAVTFKVTS